MARRATSSAGWIFGPLKAAAREVGAAQIQNRGTIGGNLCNASPAADGVPPLLIIDAEVELASARGTHRMPLDAFLLGNRRTALAPDEILTAVLAPAPKPIVLKAARLFDEKGDRIGFIKQAQPALRVTRARIVGIKIGAAATQNARKYVLLVTNTQDVVIFDLEDKIRDDLLNLSITNSP